ncbi:hypothetical protein lbkm_2623 [Lachnospiraceae bacterium KM106-2]|nr:hypothetical protein lbkm_2623 [Lachnospiraceae bacterium KM106-2]
MKKKKRKYYAIKSIDLKEVNLIVTSWEKCKQKVYHHTAVYKSFQTREEADAFLEGMTKAKQERFVNMAKYSMEKRKKERRTR